MNLRVEILAFSDGHRHCVIFIRSSRICFTSGGFVVVVVVLLLFLFFVGFFVCLFVVVVCLFVFWGGEFKVQKSLMSSQLS